MDEEVLREFLAESWENLARLDLDLVDLEKQPTDRELLANIFRTIHTLKGTCGFIGLELLGHVSHAAESVLGQMRCGELPVTSALIALILEAVDAIKLLLHEIEATGAESGVDHGELIARLNAAAQTSQEASPTQAPTTSNAAACPVAAGLNATCLTPTPLASACPPEQSPSEKRAPSIGQPLDVGDLSEAGQKSVANLSIRVDVGVVDRLMNLVGELVLTRNELLQLVHGEDESKYAGAIAQLNRVTAELQDGVMKTRMQPIEQAWSKLRRLVHDLARTTGKSIRLETNGAETELDRTVLEAIRDPMTHMIRNSADHGIEDPAHRRARGKPETATIKLTACHEGGHVLISVEDDGAGIDLDRVRRKAIQTGLISETAAGELSERETLNLIFRPGFSTADTITTISGRGVGMDVVKTQIERIGGGVDLASRTGRGTTIRLRIPLTLAIIPALIVESGGLAFAIPQLGVVELVRIAAEDRHKIERIHEHEFLRLRQRLLPLVYLNQVLELDDAEGETNADANVVVVQVGEEQLGLIVGTVCDTQEIVVKPVGQLLKSVPLYQGTTILGDGRVILILDLGGIAADAGGIAASGAREAAPNKTGENDAETTRLLLFEARGDTYAVPLSLVARLEEIPHAKIEHSGDLKLAQYRDQLLPLLPVHGQGEPAQADPQPVVVFSEGTRSMGLMVDRILDIRDERLAVHVTSQRPGILGTAVVDGRATDLLDAHYYALRANPDWFARPAEVRRRRVLVVDDSVFMRQLVMTTLEAAGYQAVGAEHGVAALRRLEQDDSIEVIVSDLEMPEMDGWALANALRTRGDRVLPLLALTSLTGGAHEQRALAAGFNVCLAKFHPREFLAAVDELHQARNLAAAPGVSA